MIPTNSLEELQRAELDLHRSQVSLIREIGKGNEKSRLQQHPDTKVPVAAVKKKAK